MARDGNVVCGGDVIFGATVVCAGDVVGPKRPGNDGEKHDAADDAQDGDGYRPPPARFRASSHLDLRAQRFGAHGRPALFCPT